MAYKVSWSDIALEDYEHIVDYLVSNWPLSVAIDFEKMVNGKLTNLSKHPFTGIRSDRNPSIRSILITKHNRLFYRVKVNNIELLSIIDTRIDPYKSPF